MIYKADNRTCAKLLFAQRTIYPVDLVINLANWPDNTFAFRLNGIYYNKLPLNTTPHAHLSISGNSVAALVVRRRRSQMRFIIYRLNNSLQNMARG